MQGLKKCKYCQSEIGVYIEVCPFCGRIQRKKISIPVVIIIVLSLSINGFLVIQNRKLIEKIEENKSDTALISSINQNVEIPSDKNQDEVLIEEKVLTISIGDIIKTNDIEVEIKKIEFSYDILPDDTSGFYTHYPADKGNVYIHIDTDVKNLAKQNLNCDEILSVKADYNNGYTYKSQAIPEDSTTGFSYANIVSIAPLKTLGVRFIISCPQEVEGSDNPLSLAFQIDGDKDIYKYIMR